MLLFFFFLIHDVESFFKGGRSHQNISSWIYSLPSNKQGPLLPNINYLKHTKEMWEMCSTDAKSETSKCGYLKAFSSHISPQDYLVCQCHRRTKILILSSLSAGSLGEGRVGVLMDWHQQGMGPERRLGLQKWAGDKHELRARIAAPVRKQARVCYQKNEVTIKFNAKNIKVHSII